MELQWIPGDPHKPRKERRGERGLSGVERYAAKGWGGRPGSGSGVLPSPGRPPTAASKGPRRPGKRGGGRERLPPHTPRLLGPLRAGPRGGESGVFAVLTGACETHPAPFPRANLARITRVSFQISPR